MNRLMPSGSVLRSESLKSDPDMTTSDVLDRKLNRHKPSKHGGMDAFEVVDGVSDAKAVSLELEIVDPSESAELDALDVDIAVEIEEIEDPETAVADEFGPAGNGEAERDNNVLAQAESPDEAASEEVGLGGSEEVTDVPTTSVPPTAKRKKKIVKPSSHSTGFVTLIGTLVVTAGRPP